MPDSMTLPGPLMSLSEGNPYLLGALKQDLDYTGTALPAMRARQEQGIEGMKQIYADDPRNKMSPLAAGMMNLSAGGRDPVGMLQAMKQGYDNQANFLFENKRTPQELEQKYADELAKQLMEQRKAALMSLNTQMRLSNSRSSAGRWKVTNDRASGKSFAINDVTGEIIPMSQSQSAQYLDTVEKIRKDLMDKGDFKDANKALEAAKGQAADLLFSAQEYNSPTMNPAAQGTPQAPVTPTASAMPAAPEQQPQVVPTTANPNEQKLIALVDKRNKTTDITERDQLNKQIAALVASMGGRNAISGTPGEVPAIVDTPIPPALRAAPAALPSAPLKQPETQASREVMGKGWGEQRTLAEKALTEFEPILDNLGSMEQMTLRGDTFSGPASEMAQKFGAWTSYLDPDGSLAKKASSGEAYFKLLQEQVRKVLKTYGTNPSNVDLMMANKSFAQLMNTQQGRLQALGALKADLMMGAEHAKGLIDYMDTNGGSLKGYTPVKGYPTVAVIPRQVYTQTGTVWKFVPITFTQYQEKYLTKKPKASKTEVVQSWKQFIIDGGK